MLRLTLCAISLSACTFAAEIPGEEEATGDDPSTPTPTTRCDGMALCLDFEDMPVPADGVQPVASIQAVNVAPTARLQETAAMFASGGRIAIGDTAKLDLTSALTVEMWVRPAAVPAKAGDQQVGLFDAHLQYELNFEWDGRIECRIHDSALETENIDSAAQLATGSWHHVACTYDGATLKVYVDGKLSGCEAQAATLSVAGTYGAAVGANVGLGGTYKNFFQGDLDDVHVYASTLTAAEICSLSGSPDCDDRCPTGQGQGDDD